MNWKQKSVGGLVVMGLLSMVVWIIGAPTLDHVHWAQEAQAQVTVTSNPQSIMNGRCTLTSNTPVQTTTVTSATTTYFTPHNGNVISLYDGNRLVPTEFSQLSNVTTASSTGNAGPAVVASGTIYDLFVWGDTRTGAKYLTRGVAWTNSSTRAVGLSAVKGVYVNGAAITNGPAVNRGTYVCTEQSSSDSTINWQYGSIASGWGQANLHLWNMYNRVNVATFLGDSTDSWTDTTASFRVANLNTGRARVSFIVGQNADPFNASYASRASYSAASIISRVAIGLDSTSTFCGATGEFVPSANTNFASPTGSCSQLPGLGSHVLYPLELGGTTVTFYGDAGAPSVVQTGLSFLLMM